MIPGPVQSRAPFDCPGLVWREMRFAVSDAWQVETATEGGAVRAVLPANLSRAVPKRRSEFLAGRVCAALALRALGLPEEVVRDGRAPVWPEGAVGSITHAGTRAIAVASRRHSALGLDLEVVPGAERAAELAGLVLSAEERALRPPAMAAKTFATLAFSAKEAFYKAFSARLGRIPDFAEVTVVDIAPGRLALAFEGQLSEVAWTCDAGACLTLLAEPPGQIRASAPSAAER